MNYSWDEIYLLIQRADQLDAGGRLTIFEFLAQALSLIPLRDGFPTPAEIEECGSLAKAAKKYNDMGRVNGARDGRANGASRFIASRLGLSLVV